MEEVATAARGLECIGGGDAVEWARLPVEDRDTFHIDASCGRIAATRARRLWMQARG